MIHPLAGWQPICRPGDIAMPKAAPVIGDREYHMSYNEIGRKMNITPRQAQHLVNSALLKLKAKRINLGLRSEDYL